MEKVKVFGGGRGDRGSSRASTGATAELSGGKQQACVYWFFCNPKATHSHLYHLYS